MKSVFKQFILIVITFSFGSTIFAQTVIRGPYLQSPTENTIVINAPKKRVRKPLSIEQKAEKKLKKS